MAMELMQAIGLFVSNECYNNEFMPWCQLIFVGELDPIVFHLY